MPTLEQQIANLVTAANALTREVTGKMAAIDQKVQQAQQDVANFIAGARAEYGGIRLSPNMRLMAWTNGPVAPATSSTTPPDGLSDNAAGALSYSEAFLTAGGNPTTQPNQAEFDKLFADLAPHGVHPAGWLGATTRVLRIQGTVANGAQLMLYPIFGLMMGQPVTVGFFCRVRTGNVQAFSSAATNPIPADNTWRPYFLFRAISQGNGGTILNYLQVPLLFLSGTVDVDIWMPAAITGNLDPAHWNLAPYLRAQNNPWLE